MIGAESAVVELAFIYRYISFVDEILNSFQYQRQLFKPKVTVITSGFPSRAPPCTLNNSLINDHLPLSTLLRRLILPLLLIPQHLSTKHPVTNSEAESSSRRLDNSVF
jgi:hypothetical protein